MPNLSTWLRNGDLQDRNLRKAILGLSFLFSIGILGLFAVALAAGIRKSAFSDFLVVLGVGILVAGASNLFGLLLGFLFGIPRSDQVGQTGGKDDT